MSESGSSVEVPSSQINPGVQSLSGIDNPLISQINPAGQGCGIAMPDLGHIWPISHSSQELLPVEFE
jgi:hypothetical protein